MMEIKVMLTAAFKEAYLELVPPFERATGNHVTSVWVSSVDMMTRLKAGMVVDLAICSVKAAGR
jgi:ABC-type molybdate transport system substrate-binding protein